MPALGMDNLTFDWVQPCISRVRGSLATVRSRHIDCPVARLNRGTAFLSIPAGEGGRQTGTTLTHGRSFVNAVDKETISTETICMSEEKKSTVSRLDEHLGFWLRRVSNHVSDRFADGLAARGMAVAEWVLLRELFDGASEPSALAERIGMTRGAVTKIVDKLVAKALVQRVSREDDRRFQTVELTAAGKKIVPVLAEIADANDAACFGGLHKAERAQLMALVKKLADGMELHSVPTE